MTPPANTDAEREALEAALGPVGAAIRRALSPGQLDLATDLTEIVCARLRASTLFAGNGAAVQTAELLVAIQLIDGTRSGPPTPEGIEAA
jgi:hypothetical protein